MPTSYNFKVALGSMWMEKWVNLIAILTISAGLFIIMLGLLAVYNINRVAAKLPTRFSVTVYLKDNLSDAEAQKVASKLKKFRSVKSIKYISKDRALSDLRSSLKDADYILEGLDENPLPASVVLKLKDKFVKSDSVKELAKKVLKIKGVDEVQYGEKFLRSIQSTMAGAQKMGLAILAVLSAGIIFVCYSTVKILFYRKQDEVETLKLLGATKGFIRAPFIIEGGIIGTLGGVIAVLGALAAYTFVFQRLAQVVPVLKSVQFPFETLWALPAAGLFIGVTGAIVALGRIRY